MSKESLLPLLQNLEQALKEQNFSLPVEKKRQGVIQSFKDGVILIKGLPDLKMSEVVRIEGTNTRALVMNIEKGFAYALVLQTDNNLKEGLFVSAENESLALPVCDEMLGRVLDPLGNPLDGMEPLKRKKTALLEKIAPGVMKRKSVSEPVQTGILAIDALIPIGRGQRELIIGDRQSGKTTIALDTILNQKGKNMICVYVSVGQREGKTSQVLEILKKNEALDYTFLISAPASSSAVLRFLAPFAGMAAAEFFMEQGKDVLVVFDDLSKHAVSYREISLLLRRPPGREAYPGDVFYLHSRLLERAAKLNDKSGGGSITALPIIETQAGDVSAYIPTNVISITDGQIFLDANLFYKGIRPAINIGISVSRVGGAAQTKIMKKVSGAAKLSLAQYYELEAFSQFASELDESTKAQLTRGRRIVESLKQKNGQLYELWQQVIILYVSTQGYLDDLPVEKCRSSLVQLLNFIELKKKKFIQSIEKHQEFTPDLEKELTEILKTFFKK